MPDYTKALSDSYRLFKRNPTSWHWQRLTVAMFAYQQEKYSRNGNLHSLALDVTAAEPEQIEAAFKAINAL